ncbi:calcium-binding protein (plasmid) [Sinorhizobium numidicum]|uniref:Calcium-binding protein n=1 Tax=Sinorhizobium numidicum TaxID=680248 RepID=A0ABY8D3G9_9HYPH|nr:calcium-binding protein [Sinorhizobium numidicum]WEX79618.1 calcium-binding protein [Sinorhizobium numidicum]WEX85426.1 calcium-binding protein [Sinorhizobium numidicum]
MARISKSRGSSTVSSNTASPSINAPSSNVGPVAQQSFTSLATTSALVSSPAYTLVQLTNSGNTYTHAADGSFRIEGLDGNDDITLAATSTGNDYLDGGAGNDKLNAAGTDDFLDGGAGIDTLNGNAGNDVLRGGAGADMLNGGAGIDTADYSISVLAVTVSLPSDPSRTSRGYGGDAAGDTLSSIENLTGSAGNDLLTGNRLDNQLVGNAGEDILRGMDGNDLLVGDGIVDVDMDGLPDDENMDGIPDGVDEDEVGADDVLDGGFGNDRLYGGGGNDTLIGGFGNDVLHGGYGVDLLNAGDGDDVLDGGAGNDTLLASLGNDTLRGAAGDDFLNASIGNDILEGGDGNDELLAGSGDDILNGGAGDDVLNGGGGDGDPLNGGDILNGGDGDDMMLTGTEADQMDGGAGNDTVSYAAGGAVGINLGTGVVSGAAAGDVLVNIENIMASSQDDILVGDGNNNTFTGGAGADQIVGQGGLDTSDYSTSAVGVTINLNTTVLDPLAIGTGTGGDAEGDTFQLIERIIGSAFVDTLNGGELNDTFMGGGGADFINGGLGTDTSEYSSSAAGVSITLDDTGAALGVGGDAEGDILTSIENLIGSGADDILTGNALTNRIDGGAGSDFIRGGANTGTEFLIGGEGIDTADYSTSGAAVIARLSDSQTSGALSSGGDAQNDVLVTMENIIGSVFDDQLIGASVANRLDGGAGNDVLIGGAGADVLIGGAGTDTAFYQTSGAGVTIVLDNTGAALGNGGDAQGDQLSTIENLIGSNFDDLLVGNASVNRLDGGGGNDTFRSGAGGSSAGGITEIIIGGAGIDTIDYSASTGGVLARLFSGTSGGLSQGGEADGDLLLQTENVIGSNFSDQLFGSTAANKLVSGSGNDQMRGGSGADILSATGTGAKTLFGDGIADGGLAGQDTYRILGGTGNVIADYQTGEDLFLNSLNATGGIALTAISIGGVATWAGRFTGTTHQTYVALGAQSSVSQAQAGAALNTLIANDLFIDPALIA